MYIKRTLENSLKKASKTFPVVLVTGPRQVGKTTMLKQAADEKRLFVTLDDPEIRLLAQKEPAMFFQTYEPPIIIDEIQYAPQLFPYIKMICDKERKNGLFWLTGSQQFQMMKNVSESLAGRVAILDMQGLSQAEKFGITKEPFLPEHNLVKTTDLKLKPIFELILKGSYPILYAQKNTGRKIFYSSYLRTYLERDVRDLLKVSDEMKFLTFLKVVAARTGQMLNYADIAKDTEINQTTAKAWISILQTSGLIYLLRPYSANLISRAVKTPKLYFLDTGLCCYLTDWNNAETLQSGAMSGAILETYVISEIFKSYWHNGEQLSAYFYRDKNKMEIDLLISQNGKLYPIEIKKTASPNTKDVKNFQIIKNAGKGAIICMSQNYQPLTKDINIIPVGYL
jgi:uncharacterized protein